MIGECMQYQQPASSSPVGARGIPLWWVEYSGYLTTAPPHIVLMSVRDDITEALTHDAKEASGHE